MPGFFLFFLALILSGAAQPWPPPEGRQYELP